MSRNFSVRTDVNLTRVNKIEKLCGMSGVYVKVEPRVAFHTLPLFQFASVNFICVRKEELCDSGNQPSVSRLSVIRMFLTFLECLPVCFVNRKELLHGHMLPKPYQHEQFNRIHILFSRGLYTVYNDNFRHQLCSVHREPSCDSNFL